MTQPSPASETRRPVEPLAGIALVLTCLIFVLPTQADTTVSMLHQGRPAAAAGSFIFWSVLICALSLLSLRRQRSQPARWRGRGTLRTVAFIVFLNAALQIYQCLTWPSE
jgi:hypothetical protein